MKFCSTLPGPPTPRPPGRPTGAPLSLRSADVFKKHRALSRWGQAPSWFWLFFFFFFGFFVFFFARFSGTNTVHHTLFSMCIHAAYTNRLETVTRWVPLLSQKQIGGRLVLCGLLPHPLHHSLHLYFSGRARQGHSRP